MLPYASFTRASTATTPSTFGLTISGLTSASATVGPSTIQSIKTAGGKVLAIEADKTILIDEPDTIRQADDAGIAIVAR